MFLGLEERIGRRLDAKERIVALIPDYAAYLIGSVKGLMKRLHTKG